MRKEAIILVTREKGTGSWVWLVCLADLSTYMAWDNVKGVWGNIKRPDKKGAVEFLDSAIVRVYSNNKSWAKDKVSYC
jgi:hypothetical protein